MIPILVSILISSTAIGGDVPAEVLCYDARTTLPVGPGSFLDASEALAVLQLADAYERGCADKTLSLAAHRDEQQTEAVATAGAASAVGGFAAGSGLLALLRRRKAPVANPPPPVAS